MTDRQVHDLLDRLFDDEPVLPDAPVAVFGQADKLRRRRRRRVLVAATAVVVLVAFAGNALTELLVPTVGPGLGTAARPAGPTASATAGAVGTPSAGADPMLAALTRDLGPNAPTLSADGGGTGWRRWAVTEGGAVTGRLNVVVYSATAGLCLPPTTQRSDTCVRMAGRNGVRYYTYQDEDRGFTQAVAVRDSDSRAYAVYAAGTDGGTAPLSVTDLKRLVLDPSLPDLFDAEEWCDRPDESCPTLGVPVPADRD